MRVCGLVGSSHVVLRVGTVARKHAHKNRSPRAHLLQLVLVKGVHAAAGNVEVQRELVGRLLILGHGLDSLAHRRDALPTAAACARACVHHLQGLLVAASKVVELIAQPVRRLQHSLVRGCAKHGIRMVCGGAWRGAGRVGALQPDVLSGARVFRRAALSFPFLRTLTACKSICSTRAQGVHAPWPCACSAARPTAGRCRPAA